MIAVSSISPKIVLLIHDDDDYSRELKRQLFPHGFEIVQQHTASGGIQRAIKGDVDIIIVDVALPDMDGYRACSLIRMYDTFAQILIVSEQPTDAGEIRGLNAGANDYIDKGMTDATLLARLRAMLRVRDGNSEIGDYKLHWSKKILIDDRNRRIRLTDIEAKLLERLIRSRGWTVPRQELIAYIWGSENSDLGHGLECHVHRLRQKIEPKPKQPFWLFTSTEGYGLRRQADRYKRKAYVATG